MTERKRPIAIDLFSGAGGMSLGFEQAGFDILASIELDPVHCATHKFNFPYSEIFCKDVAAVTAEEIRSATKIGSSQIDVVFGGSPCQGFSVIGRRDVNDPRNTLANHFVRLVSELKANYFVMENVRGITSNRNKEILETIIENFKKKGYKVADYKILNAAEYGVPQNRERLFLLGCRDNLTLPNYPERITLPLSCSGNAPNFDQLKSSIPLCPNVIEAIGDLKILEEYPELMKRDWIEAEYGSPSEYSSFLRNLQVSATDFSYRRAYNHKIITSNLRPNHGLQTTRRFAEVKQGTRESKSRFHKLHPQGISPTLRAGTARNNGSYTAARPIHPLFPRCITVREAARLHSYPDWFRFHVTNWHGLRQVGNSVPPLLAKAVASEVMRTLNIKPQKPCQEYELGAEELLYLDINQASKYFGVTGEAIEPRIRKKPVNRV